MSAARRWARAATLGLWATAARAEAPPPPAPPAVPVAVARPAADYRWPARAGAGCAPEGAPAALRLGAAPAEHSAVSALLQPQKGEADAARALGCPGGDRLLLVIDAATPQGALQAALLAAAQLGVAQVDLLVRGASRRPPGADPTPTLAGPPLTLRASAEALVIEAPGGGLGRQTLACGAGCAADDPAWGQLEAALRAVPDDTLQLWVADATLPIDRLAQAAARAGRPLAVAGGLPSAAQGAGPPPAAWPLPAGPFDTLPLALPALSRAPALLSGPPPAPDAPAPGLSRAELQQGLAAVAPRLRACGAAARAADPAQQLRASPRFIIQPDGRVAGVTWTGGPPPPPPALAGCVEAALKAAHFARPQGGGVVLVTFPLGADGAPTGSVDSIPAPRPAP